MGDSIDQYRAAIGNFYTLLTSYYPSFSFHFNLNIFTLHLYYVCSLLMDLLLLAGDIHPNPGPITSNSQLHNLGICHANVRSLKSQSKLDDLKHMADENFIDIITISETWLSSEINDNVLCMYIPGYQQILRQDRIGRAGGVAIYVRDGIGFTHRLDLEDGNQFDAMCLWVEIHCNFQSVLVGAYYRPPGQTAQERDLFMSCLSSSVTKAIELNKSALVITGDFNDRCSSWDSSHTESDLGLRLFNLSIRNSLHQIITMPTRVSDHTSSLLDLIFTDIPNQISSSGTLPPIGTSDHSVVFCKLLLKVHKPKSFSREIWNFHEADWHGLNGALSNAPFDTAYTIYDDINDIVHYWTKLVQLTAREYIPTRVVTIRMRDKPWVMNEFRRLVRKRNRLWKRFRRTNNPEHYQVYKRVRNAAVSLSRKCIKDYANSVDIQLQHNDDPKIWWKKVKALLTSKGHQSIPPIIDTASGKIVSSDYEKANIFNQFFTEQCTVPDDAKELPDFSYITHFRLSDMVITDSEVLAQLTSLKGSKATGPDAIGNILMKNVEIRMGFLDAAKAFDKVWHKGLLFKLRQVGIEGKVLNWLSSYLENRRQQVVINGCNSSVLPVKAGVPQGSVLGPLLFLVFFNDITQGIDSTMSLFADDSSLGSIVDDPNISAQTLNKDLEKLWLWAARWQVKFNPSKTEVVLFSTKRKPLAHPPLYLGGTLLTEVLQHRHLGIILTPNLSWTAHIEMIVTKASQRVGMMKRLKYVLGRGSLQKLYSSMIRPILEYGCILFDGCSARDYDLLESVQYDAARVCIGAMWNKNRQKLLVELGWEKLSNRRRYFKLLMFYKIKNSLVPDYLNILLPSVSDVHYNLRNPHRLRLPRARTDKYKLSFLPSTIEAWNSIPPDITSSLTVQIFKSKLSSHLFKSTSASYFSFGDRFCSIHHARLRLGHSSLAAHLVSHGLSCDPKCQCGNSIENTVHFFLHCAKYAAPRLELLASLSCILKDNYQNYSNDSNKLINLILNGSPSLTLDSNVNIFRSVQLYIYKSKRFM